MLFAGIATKDSGQELGTLRTGHAGQEPYQHCSRLLIRAGTTDYIFFFHFIVLILLWLMCFSVMTDDAENFIYPLAMSMSFIFSKLLPLFNCTLGTWPGG